MRCRISHNLKAMASDTIDLLAVERRVQELLNAEGVAVMR